MTWWFQETPSTECSPDSDGSLLDSTDTLEMKGKEVFQSPLYEDSEYWPVVAEILCRTVLTRDQELDFGKYERT